MKILVVAPRNSTKILPVGLAYVVAALKEQGHTVECVNLNHGNTQSIDSKAYDFVATGGLACHYADIERTLREARTAGIRTIIGGGIVTSEPELITRSLAPDFAVLGEGEVTLCELLSCLEKKGDLSRVAGIAYLDGEHFVTTEARTTIRDLDTLPLPDYEALGYETHLEEMKSSDVYYLDYFDHPRGYPIVASRSCPFPCTFCYHPLGKVYRERSVDSIMNEIAAVVPRYRINVLEILDELFSINMERLKEFCQRVNEFRATLDWELKWGCQLRVETIDRETLAMLRDAGCYNLSLGLESYSRTVLVSMKKRISPEQIREAVECILETDLRLQGNFIFGDKAETIETARETIAFWLEHPDAGILLSFVQPYPNSELYQYCLREGIITDRLDFIKHHIFDTINMTKMSEEEFFRLRIEILRLDFRYNRSSIPFSIDDDTVVVDCPHCRQRITYGNFRIVDEGALLFSLRQNRLLFSKMIYCRNCGRRFWARSLAARMLTLVVTSLLKFPAVAIKVMDIRNAVFSVLRRKGLTWRKQGEKPLDALNRLRSGD